MTPMHTPNSTMLRAAARRTASHLPVFSRVIAELDALRDQAVQLNDQNGELKSQLERQAGELKDQSEQPAGELKHQFDQQVAELTRQFEQHVGELHDQLAHQAGVARTNEHFWRYTATRYQWQTHALRQELYGPPHKTIAPPRTIPDELLPAFTLNGSASVDYNYIDATYPDNHPLIYTDAEIDNYLGTIGHNLTLPAEKQQWFIYGGLDKDVCDAIAKYPIKDMQVVNMGSLTPWYEAMFIHFGAFPTTIDYNAITLRTNRMRFMTIDDWERERPLFDAGFSISSFEHDGLGMYGDPLDPDGDFKAMRKMKERIKPGGLLYLAVPTGKDRIFFNNCRIYGRTRLPLLMDGWDWIDSFGFSDPCLDSNGDPQPLYILRNRPSL
jgi:Caenorhabditis protein of unknown function, DUF268